MEDNCKNYIHKYKCDSYRENPDACKNCELATETVDIKTLMEIMSDIETSTNPTEFSSHENFIQYMDTPDIMSFGKWMQANGFNLALVALRVELNKRGFDI